MWKRTDDRPNTPPSPQVAQPPTSTPIPAREVRPMETQKMDVAHIGKSVVIKGELSGSEDLYLDGEVEGSVELRNHSLTVGPNGKIRANVNAKEVVIHGKVDGNVRGNDRVELKKSAVLNGDVVTQRIVIEDGAFFKGSIDIQKGDAKPEAPRTMAAAAPVHAGAPPTLGHN